MYNNNSSVGASSGGVNVSGSNNAGGSNNVDPLQNAPRLSALATRFKNMAVSNPDLILSYDSKTTDTNASHAATVDKKPTRLQLNDGKIATRKSGAHKAPRRTKKTRAAEDNDLDDDETPPKPGDPPRIRIREMFMETLIRFVATVSELFPECAATRAKLALLLAAKEMPQSFNKITHEYHLGMTPYYDVILNAKECEDVHERNRLLQPFLQWCSEGSNTGEDNVLGRILRDIDLASKWRAYEDDIESQNGIFSFVHQLNAFARLAECLPPRVLKRIERFAGMYSDPEKKPQRLQETLRMSRQILQNLPAEETDQLFQNIGVVMEVIGGPDVLVEVMTESGMPLPKINLTEEFREVAALGKTADSERRATLMRKFESGSDALMDMIDCSTNDDDLLLARLEEHERLLEEERERKKIALNCNHHHHVIDINT